MAVNVPLVHISDLAEQTNAADTDCMVIGGSDAKKITIPNLVKAILAKLGVTATEFGYLRGAKSNIQGQIDTIGTRYYNSVASLSTVANVDTYTPGAKIFLPPGAYVIIGHGTFASNATDGIRRVQLYNVTDDYSFGTNSIKSQYWTAFDIVIAITLSKDTLVQTNISSAMAISGSNTTIQALRIK